MTPEIRKQVLNLLVAYEREVAKAQRKRNDRVDHVTLVTALRGGEALDLLRKIIASEIANELTEASK